MRYVQECFHGPGGRIHRCHDRLNGWEDCWILHFVPTRVMRSCLQWTCGAVACGCLLATSYTGAVALTFQIGTLLVLMWCRSWNLPLDSNFRPCPLSLKIFLISQAESLPCSIALGFGFYPHITVAQNSISVNTPSFCDLILSSLALLCIWAWHDAPFEAEMKCSNWICNTNQEWSGPWIQLHCHAVEW